MDMAAFGASQCQMLKPGTGSGRPLDRGASLASRAAQRW